MPKKAKKFLVSFIDFFLAAFLELSCSTYPIYGLLGGKRTGFLRIVNNDTETNNNFVLDLCKKKAAQNFEFISARRESSDLMLQAWSFIKIPSHETIPLTS